MEEEIKLNWRFMGNNFTTENGLDTADMETFKRDPISSLARETCQNSIDAKRDGEKKVIVEFNTFTLNKNSIPGYMRLKAEVENCREYKKNNRKDHEQLSNMINELNKDEIECLRISDFNTTGLVGDKFYLLTKGSGITDKTGTSGGSKGIGKYASFVASMFNTVFYSTYTINEERRSLGISKLCSAPMIGTEEKTIGVGFYGIDKKNNPIEEEIILDDSFNRTTPGTDLYILGFRKEKNWKQQIITKLLDSFLIAIYLDELEVRIDDIIINKDNLENIIKDDDLIIDNRKKNIYSQFVLIQEGEGVFTKEVDIMGYGNIKIFVKNFNKDMSDLATNNCIMIRYPYMKIKEKQGISTLPCSAMCIIENNELNSTLRDIENPQHTDWEPKRKEDELMIKTLKNIISEIYNEIVNFTREVVATTETDKLDIEGAGEFLPESNIGDSINTSVEETVETSSKPVVIKKVENKKRSKIPSINAEDSLGLAPDIGGLMDDGDSVAKPERNNNGTGGGTHDTDNTGGYTENGDNDVLRHVELTGIRKTFFVTNKNEGKYVVIINSNYDKSDCELEFNYYDDAENKYTVNVEECIVDGSKAEIDNGKAIHFKVHPGKTKIELTTDLKDYYKCEVRIYANGE